MKSGVFETQTLSEFGSATQNDDNKDYQETSNEVSQIPNGTSDNPNIK